MMNTYLNTYLKLWSLSNPKPLAQTYTGHLYIVNSTFGPAILKLFTDIGIKDESKGSEFLRACAGNGAVHLFKFDQRAQLMELLDEPNLYTYSAIGEEHKATQVFVNIIHSIHSVKNYNKNKLKPLKYLFNIFKRISPPDGLKNSFFKAENIAKELLKTQTDEVLLHGDLHHENVMKNSNDQFVCFDPKGFYGDPSYELATTLKNPWDYPEVSQNMDIFKQRVNTFSTDLNLPISRIIGFSYVHACMSLAWSIEDNHDHSHQAQLIKNFEPLISKLF